MTGRWTTPDDLVAQVDRLWTRGEILRSIANATPLFPRPLKLKRPTSRELGPRFEEVRQWIRELQKGSERFGYAIDFEEVSNRQLGANQVPCGVRVETETAALAMIGKQHSAKRFASLHREIMAQFPVLADWVSRYPLRVVDFSDEWPLLLRTIRWFVDRPSFGLYRRQLEIEGVDTKFIERHRHVLTELLELTLPPERLHAEHGAAFDRRFGLREKPSIVRFRLLDPTQSLQGLLDLSIPIADLAQLVLPVEEIIITENEVNGLSLPPRARTMVVFGQGYAVMRLREVEWLASRKIFYWGDIDTHGFAMLDRFRALFPNCVSLMMDRQTLVDHRAMWVTEAEPSTEDCIHLTDAEQALLSDLRRGTFGERVRLEQERISFRHVRREIGL